MDGVRYYRIVNFLLCGKNNRSTYFVIKITEIIKFTVYLVVEASYSLLSLNQKHGSAVFARGGAMSGETLSLIHAERNSLLGWVDAWAVHVITEVFAYVALCGASARYSRQRTWARVPDRLVHRNREKSKTLYTVWLLRGSMHFVRSSFLNLSVLNMTVIRTAPKPYLGL